MTVVAPARLQSRKLAEQLYQTVPMLAPTKGWVERDTLAIAEPGTAPLLQNWFPEADGVTARKGFVKLATSMGGTVESLMTYTVGTAAGSRLFAAAGGNIFRVDNSAGGAATLSLAAGATSNRWQHVQFATAGGQFLQIMNGVDNPRQWDGTTWTTPAFTGVTGGNTTLVSAFSHQSRRFYIQADTTDVYYSAIDATAGALTLFPLGPPLQRGGSIIAGSTWSRDSGTGMADAAVFISSEGEVLVYRGTNVASDWALEQRYNLGRPIGRRCVRRFGGDLSILTEDGLVSLAKARELDPTAMQQAALTRNIRLPYARAVATDSASFGWEAIGFPRGNKVVVNIPNQSQQTARQFVMNSLTGAWCEFIGMNALCWAEQNGALYFGTTGGVVHQAERGSIDDGNIIVCLGYTHFDSFDQPSALKLPTTVNTTFTAGTFAQLFVDMAYDYRAAASFAGYRANSGVRWGSGTWGSATWFTLTTSVTSANTLVWNASNWNQREWAGAAVTGAQRRSVAGRGRAVSIGFRLDLEDGSTARDSTFKIARFDVTMNMGQAA